MKAPVARAALSVLALALALAGCAEEKKGITHPTDRLHYPVSLAADPSGDYLYVVSSDFDMRYRTGSVVAIDLERHALLPETAIGIGPFGGQLALYATGDPERRLAGYVASRADGALYWFEVSGGTDGTPPRLTCRVDATDEADEIPECEDEYIVASAVRKPLQAERDAAAESDDGDPAKSQTMAIGLDAYGSSVYRGRDGVGDYLLVTNPRSGQISMFRLTAGTPMDPDEPGAPAEAPGPSGWEALSRAGQPVLLDELTVGSGAFEAAVSPDGFAWATSKFSNAIVPFRIDEVPDPDGEPRLWPAVRDATAFVISNTAIVDDFSRSLTFSPDGTRAYLAYHNPSSVVVLDTTPEDGGHRNRHLGGIDVGREPSRIVSAPSGPGGSELLYVVCFRDQQIYVVDPALLSVVDIIDLPGGPYDAVVVDAPERGRFRLYVTMFEADAVAELELDRASPYFHQVIAYIRGVDDEGAH